MRRTGLVILFLVWTTTTLATLTPADCEAFALAVVTVERLRKQKPVDWDAIKGQLRKAQTTIKRVDARHSLTYEKEISSACRKCIAYNRPDVHQQIIAKGLQHVAVLQMHYEFRQAAGAESAQAQAHIQSGISLFEAIRATFQRRDASYFVGEPTMEKQADVALAALKSAGPPGLYAARKTLVPLIRRVFALSLLYELQEIERLRKTDRKQCDIKRKEAEIFYRIIQPDICRRSRSSDRIISAMLRVDYGAVHAARVAQELKKALRVNIPKRSPAP
jgi:hypothetical protein